METLICIIFGILFLVILCIYINHRKERFSENKKIKVNIENDVNINTDELNRIISEIKNIIQKNDGKNQNTLGSLTEICSNKVLQDDNEIQSVCNSLSMILDTVLNVSETVSNNIEPLIDVEKTVNNQILNGQDKLNKISSQINAMIDLYDSDTTEQKRIVKKQYTQNTAKSNKSANEMNKQRIKGQPSESTNKKRMEMDLKSVKASKNSNKSDMKKQASPGNAPSVRHASKAAQRKMDQKKSAVHYG